MFTFRIEDGRQYGYNKSVYVITSPEGQDFAPYINVSRERVRAECDAFNRGNA